MEIEENARTVCTDNSENIYQNRRGSKISTKTHCKSRFSHYQLMINRQYISRMFPSSYTTTTTCKLWRKFGNNMSGLLLRFMTCFIQGKIGAGKMSAKQIDMLKLMRDSHMPMRVYRIVSIQETGNNTIIIRKRPIKILTEMK